MTFDDARALMKIMKAEWPQSFRGLSREDAEAKLHLWAEMFADDDVTLVGLAVKSIITAGGHEFAPQIGEVKATMRKLQQPNAMTEAEAWAQVKRAVCRSGYNSVEEYAKLPLELQKLVGSPSQLRDWAMMDVDTLDSVIGSNFQRSYRQRAKEMADWAAIPADVKAAIRGVADRMALDSGLGATRPQPDAAADWRAREDMDRLREMMQ